MESWIPDIGTAGKVAAKALIEEVDSTHESVINESVDAPEFYENKWKLIDSMIKRHKSGAESWVNELLEDHMAEEGCHLTGLYATVTGFADKSCKSINEELKKKVDIAHEKCFMIIPYTEHISGLEKKLSKAKGEIERKEIEGKINKYRDKLKDAETGCEVGIKAVAELGKAFVKCQCKEK